MATLPQGICTKNFVQSTDRQTGRSQYSSPLPVRSNEKRNKSKITYFSIQAANRSRLFS